MHEITVGLSARRSGRTKAMVEAIPENTLVVVHSLGHLDYVRAFVRDLRGEAFYRGTRVIAINCPIDAQHALIGQRRPIELDHRFIASAPPEAVRVAAELAWASCRHVGYEPRWLADYANNGSLTGSAALIAGCIVALAAAQELEERE